MGDFDVTGLVAVILVFSIPIVAILANLSKERYRAQHSQLSESDRQQLQRLNTVAEKMADRIAALESILDAEVPEWRDDYERRS